MKAWTGFLPALWATLAMVTALKAGDPAELTALRQSYQTLLAEAEAPARARWLAALEIQERQMAAQGDFEAAALIRERRMGFLTGKPVTGTGRAPVVLSPQSARTTTAVDFSDAKKEVARFRRTGAMMEWELPGPLPGPYEVKLVFGVMGAEDRNDLPDPYKDLSVALPVREATPNVLTPERALMTAGGVVEFRKFSNLREGGSVLRCSVRSTGGWATERTLPMGRVELDGKSVKFSLRAVDAQPAGAMDLRRIELVPLAASMAGGGPADAGNLKELSRLKEVYQKQFAELSRGPAAKYLKGLGELEVVAAKNRDNETLALVRQEKQRLSRPESQVTPGADTRLVRVLPVTEKLYMLASGEARLTNQGDYLTKLRPANGCEITWKLAGLGVASGTYSVEVECRLTPEHGGSAVLVATTPGGSPGPMMPLTVEPAVFDPYASMMIRRRPDLSPATSTLRQFKAGQVTIPKGSEYLKLQVTSLAVPDGALCDLKLLRLTPVPSESP